MRKNLLRHIQDKTGAAVAFMLAFFVLAGISHAAGIRIVPSTSKVSPGESFYVDVVADNVPDAGLGAFQFRLNVGAAGSNVAGLTDFAQARPEDVSVVTPLLVGPFTDARSGLGDLFWRAKGANGVLVMDNEPLAGGTGLYTFAHTNGAVPSSGSGPIARFLVKVGSLVSSDKIDFTFADVMLMESGVEYALEGNAGAVVDLKCYAKVPELRGLAYQDALAALQQAKLKAGSVYEIDNFNGVYQLGRVLAQSSAAGAQALCDAAVDMAVNTAPLDPGQVAGVDKAGDDAGAVVLSWQPSASIDAAGYRVYSGVVVLKDLTDPLAAGVQISGLTNGATAQLRVSAYDVFGNESPGVNVSVTPLDDVPPVISIGGILDGLFSLFDIVPSIAVTDAGGVTTTTTLNGLPYSGGAITADGAYTLTVTVTDGAGNTAAKTVSFVIDKTPPSLNVTGVAKGMFYNTDVVPVVNVTDANLSSSASTLNGSAYSGSVVSAEGAYELKISATDKAGNSASETYVFYIDKSAPASDLAVGTPAVSTAGGGYFVSGTTSFTLSAVDAGAVLSGISAQEYRLNNGSWLVYSSPFTLSGLADGAYAVDYRAADNAGNAESAKTLNVTADNTAPETRMDITGAKFTAADGRTYTGVDALFTLVAADGASGVKATEYRIDGGAWVAYQTPFSLQGDGAHAIEYRSTDNVDNAEALKIAQVLVDTTAPETVASVGVPQYAGGPVLYVSGATAITLSSTDAASGVAKIEYRIDGGVWSAYQTPFSLQGEGAHTIDYRATDNAGNVEAAKTLSVTVDETAPETRMTMSDGTPYGQGVVVTAKTTVTLSVADNLSGIRGVYYRFDDAPTWVSYGGAFDLATLAYGRHSLQYYSVDNVGNKEAVKSAEMTVVWLDVKTETLNVPRVLVWTERHKNHEYAAGAVEAFLRDAFAGYDAYYSTVSDKEEFIKAFRSGVYNVVAILGEDAPEDALILRELREGVRRGIGIIVSGWKDGEQPALADVFGITKKGKGEDRHDEDESSGTLTLAKSAISGGETVATYGDVSIVEANGGSVIGTLSIRREHGNKTATGPGVVLNEFGRGKALFMAFDIVESALASGSVLYTDLLRNAAFYMLPENPGGGAASVMLLETTATLNGVEADVRMKDTLSDGLAYVPLFDLNTTLLEFEAHLLSGQSGTYRYFVRPGDRARDYTKTTDVYLTLGGQTRAMGSNVYTITVADDSASLAAKAKAQLEDAKVAHPESADKINEILAAFAEVESRPAVTRDDLKKVIRGVVQVIFKVEKLKFDADSIRTLLDEYLRIKEAAYYSAQDDGKEKKDDDDDDSDDAAEAEETSEVGGAGLVAGAKASAAGKTDKPAAFEGLKGGMEVSPSGVLRAATVKFNVNLRNTGGRDVDGATLTITITDAKRSVVKTLRSAVSVAADASAALNLSTAADFNAGTYGARLDVGDKTVASASFDVLDGGVTVKNSVPDFIRVLVWLNECVKDETQGTASTDKCVDAASVEKALEDAGAAYYIVKSAPEFELELRNIYYTDYLILGDREPLGLQPARELKERVNAGSGVAAALLNEPSLFGLFGIESIEALSITDNKVEFTEGFAGAGVMQSRGNALKVTEDKGAARLAKIPGGKGKAYPGVIASNYGDGKAVYMAFDIGLSLGRDEKFADVVKSSLVYVHRPEPVGGPYLPYALVPVKLDVKGIQGVGDFMVTENYPAGFRLVDTSTGTWIKDNPWVKEISKADGALKFVNFFALTPDAPGVYTLTTSVSYTDKGAVKSYQAASIDINVAKSTKDVINDLINRLNNGLNGLAGGKDGEKAASAAGLLQKIRDRATGGKAELEKDIASLLDAIDAISGMEGAEARGARLDMDRLLGVLGEMRYLEDAK